MESKFRNKNGELSAYSFACGYVQHTKERHTDAGAVYLYMEHCCYHVRVFGADVWESTSSLTKARKMYKQLCKQYK